MSGPSKRWPRMTTDPVRARFREKRLFLHLAEKWFFGQKYVLPKKKTKRDWYLFWKRVLFSLNNFSRSWPEQGVQPKVNVVFGPEISVFGQKIHRIYDEYQKPNFLREMQASKLDESSATRPHYLTRSFLIPAVWYWNCRQERNFIKVDQYRPSEYSDGLSLVCIWCK